MVLWKSDREINFVAAKFYLAEQQYELAEKAIKYTISEGDLQSQLPRGYYEEQFQLYRDILIRSGRDPLKLKLIKEHSHSHSHSGPGTAEEGEREHRGAADPDRRPDR